MVFIYVLQLEENKWYIGKTETSKFRIDTHFDYAGSEFTKKYRPQEIYQIIPECDKFDEDKFVKKYMDKYGIDNVRGGTYSKLELSGEERKFIQKELWGANDLCFQCGGHHFIKDCTDKENTELLIEEQVESPIEEDEKMKWIEHYKNELFELTEGCWVRMGSHFPEDFELPIKIYCKHTEFKIDMSNIQDISKYIRQPGHSHGGTKVDGYVKERNVDISKREHEQPPQLVIKLKTINDIKYICPKSGAQVINSIEYKFYTNKELVVVYQHQHLPGVMDRVGMGEERDAFVDKFIDEKKREIEYKLFMFKNDNQEQLLKLSTVMSNKINMNKKRFENTFNNILLIIDDAMNCLPDKVIAQQEKWSQAPPQNDFIKLGEEYKPESLVGIQFRMPKGGWSASTQATVIACYNIQLLGLRGQLSVDNYLLFMKLKNKQNIELYPNDSQLICQKLNELGFITGFTRHDSTHHNLNAIMNESFVVIFDSKEYGKYINMS